MEGGGVALWAIAVIGGTVALGAILAFGQIRNRRRRKRQAAGEGEQSS